MRRKIAPGDAMIRILTPAFNITPDGPPDDDPEAVLDRAAAMGATFCLPHQCVTDALLDRRAGPHPRPGALTRA